MVITIEKIKEKLKLIKKGEEPNGSHIVFKQRIVCNDKKKTQYYLYNPEDKEDNED